VIIFSNVSRKTSPPVPSRYRPETIRAAARSSPMRKERVDRSVVLDDGTGDGNRVLVMDPASFAVVVIKMGIWFGGDERE